MNELTLLETIYRRIKGMECDQDIHEISFDNDNDSGEIIIDFKDDEGNDKNMTISMRSTHRFNP